MEKLVTLLKFFSATLLFIGGGFASNWGNKFGDFTDACKDNPHQTCFLKNAFSDPSFTPLITIVIINFAVGYKVFELETRLNKRQKESIEERVRRETRDEMESSMEWTAGTNTLSTALADTETDRVSAETILLQRRNQYQEIKIEYLNKEIERVERERKLKELKDENP